MDLYLVVMSRIFNHRALQLSARMAKGDGYAYVPLETVAPVVEELLPVMDEVRGSTGLGQKGKGRVYHLEVISLDDYYNSTKIIPGCMLRYRFYSIYCWLH